MQTVLAAGTDLLEKLEINPMDEAVEIAQNVAALMATPKGSVPLMRGMGLSLSYQDLPQNVAIRQYEAEMALVLDEYEPRAEMQGARINQTEDGWLKITAEVAMNGG